MVAKVKCRRFNTLAVLRSSLGSFYTAIVRRPLGIKSRRRIPSGPRGLQECGKLAPSRRLLDFGIIEVGVMKFSDGHFAFANADGRRFVAAPR
jgi:hypothetical protein